MSNKFKSGKEGRTYNETNSGTNEFRIFKQKEIHLSSEFKLKKEKPMFDARAPAQMNLKYSNMKIYIHVCRTNLNYNRRENVSIQREHFPGFGFARASIKRKTSTSS